MSGRDRLAFGLVVAAVVIVPGLASALVHSMGYPTLGAVIWTIGFGSGVITIWYVWIRPLDLRPPTGRSSEDADHDR